MSVELKSTQFRKEREETWRQLEELVLRIDKRGVRALDADELTRLPGLYRASVSALSVARAISLDRNLIEYLEGLCGRAYFHVYSNRRGFWSTVAEFLLSTFPNTLRRNKWFVLTATLFLVSGATTGFVMTTQDPDRYAMFVPTEMSQGRDTTSSREELLDVIYPESSVGEALSAFASMLFSNNSRVGMLCFALGIIPAIPVFYLLFFNGLLLGAFAALHHQHGLSLDLWGWLLPHGVTELFAIVLCGAGGLILGHGLVFPGRSTRRENLGRRGREAATLVLGAVCMLFIAALIEGFFRQLVHDMAIRYGLAIGTTLFWIYYFGFLGRARQPAEVRA